MNCPKECRECKIRQEKIVHDDIAFDTEFKVKFTETIYFCEEFPEKVEPDKCSQVDHVITNKQLTEIEQNILNAINNLHNQADQPFLMADLNLTLKEIKILKEDV